MACIDHTELPARREADISKTLNDRRSDVAARLMRRAVRRVGLKRAYLEVDASGRS